MNTDLIAGLRQLWQASFGDSDVELDRFFSTSFSPDRCHYLEKDGAPVSALYWLPCTLEGRNIAYLYAIATDAIFRGQGLCRQLMAEAHEILQQQGYAGAILVPAEPGLFDLYRKFGYRVCCTCREFSCDVGEPGLELRSLAADEYARLRAEYLPRGSVLQEGVTLQFLQEHASFYVGDGFLLTAATQGDMLICRELLGDPSAAAGIVRSLGCSHGSFRTPGPGRDFAMYLPLAEACPIPRWFGLALD